MFGFCCNAVRFILGPGKEVPWINPFTPIRGAVTFLLHFCCSCLAIIFTKKMTVMIHDNFDKCFGLAELGHKAPQNSSMLTVGIIPTIHGTNVTSVQLLNFKFFCLIILDYRWNLKQNISPLSSSVLNLTFKPTSLKYCT